MFQIVNKLNSRLSISSPQHTYQTKIKSLIFGKCHRHDLEQNWWWPTSPTSISSPTSKDN